jgi:hypothetical protein
MGNLLHPIRLNKVPSLPRRVWVCVVRMDNQFLTDRSWPLVAPTDNLREDFSRGVGGVKTSTLGQDLDDKKPSSPSNNRQHEFRRLNRVTLSLWWCLSQGEPYPFMISV